MWNSRLGCSVSGKMLNPQVVDLIKFPFLNCLKPSGEGDC